MKIMPIRTPFCESEINFVKLVDAVIKSKGLTRDFVHKATDISASSLSHFFSMKSFLSIPATERLCQFLNIPCLKIANVSQESPLIEPLDVIEKEHIIRALKSFNWDIETTHKALGVTKYYIYSRIQKFGIKKPQTPFS